jgi:hypothetical protein
LTKPGELSRLENKLRQAQNTMLQSAQLLAMTAAGIAGMTNPGMRKVYRQCLERAQGALDSYECALKRIEDARDAAAAG